MYRFRAFLLLMLFTAMPASATERITLFAAASMTNALQEVISRFEAQQDIEVTPVYAASSALARQIARGAPATVFISANRKWMDYLQQQGVVEPSNRATLLNNRLVIIASRDYNTESISLDAGWPLKQQLDGERLAMADPDHVPAGIYAKQALQSLGLWQQAATLITRSRNVRSALALVERGETPLGIVYKTDAMVSPNVRIVAEFPAGSHPAIEYPMALITGSGREDAGNKLYQYLRSEEAAGIFHRYGFRNAH
ncbi:molybdate ABC transporter substrate-binding protein [Marinobacterium jannaschii]|uniref:molybdate ABC transporter substrate-binding protein n=1 Tax=Marinobacterium jannaschii TaxID=64970 RepID=UPI00047FF230|nr:molybdate ABC transporter substrate-binding protein [Marinobacterium jannaschii]